MGSANGWTGAVRNICNPIWNPLRIAMDFGLVIQHRSLWS
jgi:hypothetical protein